MADDDAPEKPGGDQNGGGTAPPAPPPTDGGEDTTDVTKTTYPEHEAGQKVCGPLKKVTWHFKNGKRTGSTVETWKYGDNCIVLEHTKVEFDEDGVQGKATAEGTHTPQAHSTGKKKIEKHYRWVWKPGETEPEKYIVTTTTILDDNGNVVETHETVHPIK